MSHAQKQNKDTPKRRSSKDKPGKGTPAKPRVAHADRTLVAFASLALGKRGEETVTIKNTSKGASEAYYLEWLGGRAPTDFSLLERLPIPVGASSSIRSTFAFHPTAIGLRTATARLYFRGDAVPVVISLQGEGQAVVQPTKPVPSATTPQGTDPYSRDGRPYDPFAHDAEPLREGFPPLHAHPAVLNLPATTVNNAEKHPSEAKFRLTPTANNVVVETPRVSQPFEVPNSGAFGGDLTVQKGADVVVRFRPRSVGRFTDKVSLHERAHANPLTVVVRGEAFGNPTLTVPPRKMIVQAASKFLIETRLRSPAEYLAGYKQRQAGLKTPRTNGVERLGNFFPDLEAIQRLHGAILLKENNRPEEESNKAAPRMPDPLAAKKSAQRANKKNDSDLLRVAHETREHEDEVAAKTLEAQAAAELVEAAITRLKIAVGRLRDLRLKKKVKELEGQIEKIRTQSDHWLRSVGSALKATGKISKWVAKRGKVFGDAMGEALEGAGELLTMKVLSAPETAKLKALGNEVASIKAHLDVADILDATHQIDAAASDLDAHRALLEKSVIEGRNLHRKIENNYVELGSRAAHASGDPTLAGRIAPLPDLTEINRRLESLADDGDLGSLHTVDDPAIVRSATGGSASAYQYAKWAADNLPRFADALEALKPHYEKRQNEARIALRNAAPTAFDDKGKS